MAKEKIGVLVVEDSEGLLQLLVRTMERDPKLEVKGVARNGEEAVERTLALKPDVITMDLNMPKMDGVEAIRRIMASRPTPIVVVTSISDSEKSFEAIRAGALEVLVKPQAINTPEGAKSLAFIVDTVKIMADVKVMTRKTALTQPLVQTTMAGIAPATGPLVAHPATPKIVALASSTGGPPALSHVLKKVDTGFPAPILIVQHITTGFGRGLVEWLDSVLKVKVQEAADGETPKAGQVYVAPDNYHLLIDAARQMRLSKGLPIKGHRPSADLLFESVGQHYGPSALGIILTGMGDDGRDGLKILKRERGFCIAQDEASSIVFGMPKAAIDAGLADQVMDLDGIGNYLLAIAMRAAR